MIPSSCLIRWKNKLDASLDTGTMLIASATLQTG
jgi:hypothetical protein